MRETAAFVAGFTLVAAGMLALVYPLHWIGIRSRGFALVVIAIGFLVVAWGAETLDSYLVYLGFTFAFLGLISCIYPLRFLWIRTRGMAALVLAFGVLLSIGTSLFPYGERHVTSPTTRLDYWMPRWQVGETHAIEINAPPEKVFAAIHAVRADEILLFRTLIAIRRCGQDGPESILAPAAEKPLLDVATETTFFSLDNSPPREIVVGTVIAAPRDVRTSGKLTPELFMNKTQPGVVLATMNFVVTPTPSGGSTVTTETRIFANSPASLRRFGVYWRVIHPGSDIIRRMWLRAIVRRAEKA
jgi:hypothetical protein